MNVAIASAFRQSSHSLPRYFRQVEGLRDLLLTEDHSLRLIAGEGDSHDNTRQRLANYRGVSVQIVDTTHGKRMFGSTEEFERLQVMSRIGNQLFEAVQLTDDVLVYIESDLHWEPSVIHTLIKKAQFREDSFDVFAPMIFAGPHFYDIWGFRKNGLRFGPFKPYHPCINGNENAEIDSAGSCLVMRGDVARKSRIRNEYCLVGWCEDARANGYRIAACPNLKIYHP